MLLSPHHPPGSIQPPPAAAAADEAPNVWKERNRSALNDRTDAMIKSGAGSNVRSASSVSKKNATLKKVAAAENRSLYDRAALVLQLLLPVSVQYHNTNVFASASAHTIITHTIDLSYESTDPNKRIPVILVTTTTTTMI